MLRAKSHFTGSVDSSGFSQAPTGWPSSSHRTQVLWRLRRGNSLDSSWLCTVLPWLEHLLPSSLMFNRSPGTSSWSQMEGWNRRSVWHWKDSLWRSICTSLTAGLINWLSCGRKMCLWKALVLMYSSDTKHWWFIYSNLWVMVIYLWVRMLSKVIDVFWPVFPTKQVPQILLQYIKGSFCIMYSNYIKSMKI